MTIEQEFFEVFGIAKIKCDYTCKEDIIWDSANNPNHDCLNCDGKNTSYQPITAEIVLKLEEILSRCGGIDYYESFNFMGTKKSGYRYYKSNRNYRLNIKESTAESRADALCGILIQFKDEIQDQVKELFNAG